MLKHQLLAGACRFALLLSATAITPLAAQAADAGSASSATAVSGVVVQGEVITTAPRTVPLTAA